MTHRTASSTTNKFAILSFAALFTAIGVRFAVTPEATPAVPETGALIESRLPTQQSVPLAQVLATQVHIERLMAAGLIEDQNLDEAFQLLEQSSHTISGFVSNKGMRDAEEASLKMIRSGTDAELYGQYRAMSNLIEQSQVEQ